MKALEVALEGIDGPLRSLLAEMLARPETNRDNVSDLATAVYAASGGTDPACAALLDAAAFAYWRGFDVLDDIADGDSAAKWPGHDARALTLAASTLFAGIAPRLIAALPIGAEVIVEMQRAAVNCGIAMAQGQMLDLALRAQARSEEALRAVRGKSGAEFAMFALLGSLAAKAPASEAFYEFGMELGIAMQLASDLMDAFIEEPSRDLMHGARTAPIVYGIELAGETARAELLAALDSRDPFSWRRARELLLATSALRRTLFEVQIHRARAFAALEAAVPSREARATFFPFEQRLDTLLRTQDSA